MTIGADDPELWFVDDVPLNTLGYNISSWGATRQAPPGLRGADYVVPYRPGTVWNPKTMDSGTITLGMWVQGSDPTTGLVPVVAVTHGASPWYLAGTTNVQLAQKQFRTNWRTLRRLLFTPNRQFVLKKTFYDDVTDSNITATTMAQYSGGLELDINGGPNHAAFTVDLLLSDRRFYSTDNIDSNYGVTLAVGGDVFTNNIQLTIAGGGSRMKNDTTGVSVTNNNTGSITLNCFNYTSTGNLGNVVISGPPGPWFWLEPGNNVLSGLGTASLTYNRAWL